MRLKITVTERSFVQRRTNRFPDSLIITLLVHLRDKVVFVM